VIEGFELACCMQLHARKRSAMPLEAPCTVQPSRIRISCISCFEEACTSYQELVLLQSARTARATCKRALHGTQTHAYAKSPPISLLRIPCVTPLVTAGPMFTGRVFVIARWDNATWHGSLECRRIRRTFPWDHYTFKRCFNNGDRSWRRLCRRCCPAALNCLVGPNCTRWRGSAPIELRIRD
jgi:hypothetical protein